MSDGQRPAGFEEGVRALAGWLDATKDAETTSDPAIFEAMENASKRLADQRETGRDKIFTTSRCNAPLGRRLGTTSNCSPGPTARSIKYGVLRNR